MSAGLADMQLISEYNKEVWYSFYVLLIFRLYLFL